MIVNAELQRQHDEAKARKARIHRTVCKAIAAPIIRSLPQTPATQIVGELAIAHIRAWRADRAANCRVLIADVARAAASEGGITSADIRGHRRTKDVVIPRQVGMFVACTLGIHSLPKIGRAFGDKDHTTVMHARNRIAERMQSEPNIADLVQRVREAVGAPL